MEAKFVIYYNNFLASIREKKYTTIVAALPDFEFDFTNYRHFDKIQYILRTSFIVLKFNVQNPESHCVAHIVNQFERFLGLAATNTDCLRFLAILNQFSKKSDLENCLTLFTDTTHKNLNVESWLHSISDHLAAAKSPDKTVDLKEVFLELSRSALIYLNVETSLNAHRTVRRFDETLYFLDKCIKLRFFNDDIGNDGEQYRQCFQTIKRFVNACEPDADFEKQLKMVIDDLNNSKNIVRATLVKDLNVTIAKFIYICRTHLIDSITANNIKIIYKLIYRLIEVLRSISYEKTFCSKCTNGIGLHEIDVITTVAISMYKDAIKKNMIDKTIIEEFSKIYTLKLIALSKLQCETSRSLQAKALYSLNEIISLCQTKEKTEFAMPLLSDVLKNLKRIKVSSLDVAANENYFLRKLFDLLKINENWTELIHVGYLMLPFWIAASEENSNIAHNIIYTVSLTQQQQKETVKFQTPYDYFTDKNSTFYYLNISKDIDYVKIMLCYLKISNIYITPAMEYNNKIIYQILMLAPNADPLISLRFIFYVEITNYNRFAARIQTELNRLNVKASGNSAGLLTASFNYTIYLNNLTEISEKFKAVSIKEELDKKPPSTLFDEQNLFFERNQFELLRNAKKQFIAFVEFYLDKAPAKRVIYNDEVQYLLKRLKSLALNLTVRDYQMNAMDTYMALFRLSKVANDQFGLISACSYFAEYSNEFNKRLVADSNKMNLSEILDDCYAILVEQISKLSTLSLRKQNEIFFCLLNIVLYYMESSRILDAKQLLKFVLMQIGSGDSIEGANNAKTNSTIQYNAVRIKYYSVLFTMISKYNEISPFSPLQFAEFTMEHIRNNIHLTAEDPVNIAIILFKLIPDIVTYCLNRYEATEEGEVLLLTLIKIAFRMGLVRRTINAMLQIALIKLFGEKCDDSEVLVGLLEIIFSINSSTLAPSSNSLKMATESILTSDSLNEPIRKETVSVDFIKCVSPYKVIKDNSESYICRYLQRHLFRCTCIICECFYNKFLLFQTACIFSRLVYLRDLHLKTKKSVHIEIYRFWKDYIEKDSKPIEINDAHHMVGVRMLIWSSHHFWKFEQQYAKAKNMLIKAETLLKKIPHYDAAVAQDIAAQISSLNNFIDGATNKEQLLINKPKNYSFERDELVINRLKPRPKIKVSIFNEITTGSCSKIPNSFKILDDTTIDLTQNQSSKLAEKNSEISDILKHPKNKIATKTQQLNEANCNIIKNNEENQVIDLTSPPNISDLNKSLKIQLKSPKKKSSTRFKASKDADCELSKTMNKSKDAKAKDNTTVARVTRSRKLV